MLFGGVISGTVPDTPQGGAVSQMRKICQTIETIFCTKPMNEPRQAATENPIHLIPKLFFELANNRQLIILDSP